MNDHAEEVESSGDKRKLMASEPERVATGIEGLDNVLRGGVLPAQTYLVRGDSGSGKTTLAMQFCLAGARRGERVLFLSMNETEMELRAIARTHGWSLDGMVIHYHDVREHLGGHASQSVFPPAEVELPQTMDALLSVID